MGPDVTPTVERTQRIAVYVDGFTVYYGLLAKGYRRYLWLDYRALASRFVRRGDVLVGVKYFTSRVAKPAGSRLRQGVYLDALAAHGGVDIVEGKHEARPVRCPGCGDRWEKPKEKMTDVALATTLVLDASDDLFDTALLVCADSDQIPAVDAVRSRYGKRVILVSPPGRRSDDLVAHADANLHIRRPWLSQCQLPASVVGATRTFDRPPSWA